MKSSTTKKGKHYTDTFIREVRATYQPTATTLFAIKGPYDVADFVRSILTDNSREHVVALYLDGANQVASYSIVSIGTANASMVHPREVFQRAILAVERLPLSSPTTTAIRNSDVNEEDHKVTKRLKEAGEILGIKLLDHLIISDASNVSIIDDR